MFLGVLWQDQYKFGAIIKLPVYRENKILKQSGGADIGYLVGLLEDKPLDAEKWKLPGQAVLDAALGLQGMELLAKWTQLSKK